MKTAISVPDEVFARVDEHARRRGLSRSAVFTAAASEYLRRHRAEDVTRQLNAVYAKEDSTLDPALALAQARTLPREDWP
jgi:metal-responsive CopG/Arc/MetJ family transcriptional regulator